MRFVILRALFSEVLVVFLFLFVDLPALTTIELGRNALAGQNVDQTTLVMEGICFGMNEY